MRDVRPHLPNTMESSDGTYAPEGERLVIFPCYYTIQQSMILGRYFEDIDANMMLDHPVICKWDMTFFCPSRMIFAYLRIETQGL